MDPPSLKEFFQFYTLKSSKGNLGFYYFAKQATKDVQIVTKIKERLGNWKDAYFFTLETSVRGCFSEPRKLLIVFILECICMRHADLFSDTWDFCSS